MGLPEAHQLLNECQALACKGQVMDAWINLERAKVMLLKEFEGDKSSSSPHGIVKDLLSKLETERERCQSFAEGNFLAVLGLCGADSVNDKVVKKAYKKLALRFHPDKNAGVDTAPLFTLLRNAYESLSNAGQRYSYTPKETVEAFIVSSKRRVNPFQTNLNRQSTSQSASRFQPSQQPQAQSQSHQTQTNSQEKKSSASQGTTPEPTPNLPKKNRGTGVGSEKYPGYERARQAAQEAAEAKANVKGKFQRRYSDPFSKSTHFSTNDCEEGSAARKQDDKAKEPNFASASEASVRAMKLSEIQAMLKQLGLASNSIDAREDLIEKYMKAMYNAGVGAAAAAQAKDAYARQSAEQKKQSAQASTPNPQSNSIPAPFDPLIIKAMSNKELKRFLKSRSVDTTGCMEREEYLMRVLEALSNKELKKLLATCNYSCEGCVERNDFLKLAVEALQLNRKSQNPAPQQSDEAASSGGKPPYTQEAVLKMGIKELRALLKERGADAEGVLEKAELISRVLCVLGLAPDPQFSRRPSTTKKNKRTREQPSPGTSEPDFDPSNFKMEYMSSKELLSFLKARKVETAGCFEKEDFMRLALEALSNKELKAILKNRGVDTSGCFERNDFVQSAYTSFCLGRQSTQQAPQAPMNCSAETGRKEDTEKNPTRKGKGLFVNRARVELGHGEAKPRAQHSPVVSEGTDEPKASMQAPIAHIKVPNEVHEEKNRPQSRETTSRRTGRSPSRVELPEIDLQHHPPSQKTTPVYNWPAGDKQSVQTLDPLPQKLPPRNSPKPVYISKLPPEFAPNFNKIPADDKLGAAKLVDQTPHVEDKSGAARSAENISQKTSGQRSSTDFHSVSSAASKKSAAESNGTAIQGLINAPVKDLKPEQLKKIEKILISNPGSSFQSKESMQSSPGSYYWGHEQSTTRSRPGSAFTRDSEARGTEENSVQEATYQVHPVISKSRDKKYAKIKPTAEEPRSQQTTDGTTEKNKYESSYDFSVDLSEDDLNFVPEHKHHNVEEEEEEPMDWIPKRPRGLGNFEDESGSDDEHGPSDNGTISSEESDSSIKTGFGSTRSDGAVAPDPLEKMAALSEKLVDPSKLERRGTGYVKWLRDQVPERKYAEVKHLTHGKVQTEVDFWIANAQRETELRRLSKKDFIKPSSAKSISENAEKQCTIDDSGLGSNNKGAWFWGKK